MEATDQMQLAVKKRLSRIYKHGVDEIRESVGSGLIDQLKDPELNESVRNLSEALDGWRPRD